MKKLADVLIVIGAVALIAAVISRLAMVPLMGIFASAIVQFASACLLLAIALLLKGK